METSQSDSRYTMLAVAWGLWFALGVVLGLSVAVFFGGLGGLMTVLPDSNTGEPAPVWFGFLFGGMGLVIGGIVSVVSVVGIVVAVALGRRRTWAMIAICVLSVLNLTSFPVGTVLGVLTLWTLMNDAESPLGRRRSRG